MQNKIKDLEEKLEDERHHRLVMQNKAHKVYGCLSLYYITEFYKNYYINY